MAHPTLGAFTKYSWLGVKLFFIISEYVVLISAAGKIVKQFLLSRVTCLYLAYRAACTLTFVFMRLFGLHPSQIGYFQQLGVPLKACLVNMNFMAVERLDIAYWLLAVEISFYFLIIILSCNLFCSLPIVLLGWLIFVAYTGLISSFVIGSPSLRYFLQTCYLFYNRNGFLFVAKPVI